MDRCVLYHGQGVAVATADAWQLDRCVAELLLMLGSMEKCVA